MATSRPDRDKFRCRYRRKETGLKTRHYNRSEERFLSAQADPFAGAKGKEKVGLLRSE
jgi:hypothetical protein